MGKAFRAFLFSALVFPGAGHIYLKVYSRGVALIAVTLVCLAIVISVATREALTVVDQIEAQGGIASTEQLMKLATEAEAKGNSDLQNIATYVLLGCWIFGMVDAVRLGAKKSG